MKQRDLSDLRRPAKIERVFRGKEDHGIETVTIHLEGPGWGQGFGCLCMTDEAESRLFLQEMCAAFDLADPERLVGLECHALYSTPYGTIDGLEAPSGKRFTIRGWRKRHYPDHAPTPTEEKRESLLNTIAWAERRAAQARADLAALPELIDWEEQP